MVVEANSLPAVVEADMVSSTKTQTDLETKTLPSAYGTTGFGESARLSGQLEKLLATNPNSAYSNPLTSALLNPSYVPASGSEQAVLEGGITQAQGVSAVRGLGPATQSGLVQALAPTLSGLRQQNIGNLQGAQEADLTQQLAQRGIDMTALNELIGYAMPQTVAGTKTSNKGGPGSGSKYDPTSALNKAAGRLME